MTDSTLRQVIRDVLRYHSCWHDPTLLDEMEAAIEGMVAERIAAPFLCETHMCGACGGCKAAKVRDLMSIAERVRMDVEKVLGGVLDADERAGAGAGLAADVRLALAKAWEEGAAEGAECESRRVSNDPDDWQGLELPTNPYRPNSVASSAENPDPGRCNFRNAYYLTNRAVIRDDGWRCGKEAGHVNGHCLYSADGETVLDTMGPWALPFDGQVVSPPGQGGA